MDRQKLIEEDRVRRLKALKAMGFQMKVNALPAYEEGLPIFGHTFAKYDPNLDTVLPKVYSQDVFQEGV